MVRQRPVPAAGPRVAFEDGARHVPRSLPVLSSHKGPSAILFLSVLVDMLI